MSDTEKSSPLKDPLEDLLGYQLRRAAFVTVSVLAESFAELGLSSTEAIILRFVHANPGCTQADIGRAIGVQRTNMVPIVNGLIGNALLERTPADGRSHSLYLTEQGTQFHRKVIKVGLEHERRFFADVSEETRQTLMKVFRAVRRKAEQP
jgi:DNA-binding MarR family transcriptional regulator